MKNENEVRIGALILIWATAIALAATLYTYGLTKYYWYANDQGRGYSLARWHGQTLDNTPRYPKGYSYRYEFSRFDKQAERRILAIILILSAAGATSIFVMRKKASTPQK